jgi:ATP-dependent Zn protease
MFLFTACKTSSRLKLNTETSRKTDVQLVKYEISKDTIAKFQTTNKNVIYEITEETTMYDTSKPNVAGTDHPPEIKRIIKRIKASDNSMINKQTYSNNQIKSESQLNRQTKECIKDKINENRKSKAMFSIPLWIYLAVIIVIFAVFYIYCPSIRIIIYKILKHK